MKASRSFCVMTFALLMVALFAIAGRETSAQMNKGSGFLGGWCAQGNPAKQASISRNGAFLTLTNENGDASIGNFQGSNQIVAPGWQFVTGTLSGDGSQINWSNGTFWARCTNGGGGNKS